MTKEQFDLWKDVSSTIRLDEQGSVHLIDRTNNVLVMILWAHRGIHEYSSIQTKNDTRFLVKVHQGEDLSSIQPELVERAFDVQKYDHLLVNCKEPNHAILYSISLEPSNRVFKLSIELHPELGHSIISEAEKNKIEINY